MKAAEKVWTPTKYQQIYRHKSGTYYARIDFDGKRTWRSLRTTVLSVAKGELDNLRLDASERKELSPQVEVSDRMTGADVIELRKRQLEVSPEIKTSTRSYWNMLIRSLERKWPEFCRMQLRRVTEEQCQEWAGKAVKSMSSTRFNNSVSLLRTLFEIAIKKGVRRTNPASSLKRVKVKSKDLSSRLPTRQKFSEWVAAIRAGHGRFSHDCADYVEFLAYTGMRSGEAKWVEWRHCDLVRGEILIVGDPKEGTKNSEFRRVPIIPAAKSLLERLQLRRESGSANERVLWVREAQKSMDRAGKKVGMDRITHHDLRHFFATICIESGVDIPTVAKWLGHKDGGALAMKVYGHLRNEHSLAAATRVSFAA